MSYLKYTALFVFVFFGMCFAGINIVGGNTPALIIFIASVIASIAIANIIIKLNSRVMILKEITKYTLCFSVVIAMIMISVAFIMVMIVGLADDPDYQSFGGYIAEFVGLVIFIFFPILIIMFLVNMYFKNRYKNG